MLRESLLLALLLTLSACGFSLRSSEPATLSLDRLQLQAPATSQLSGGLQRALSDAGVAVSTVDGDSADASDGYTLRLSGEELSSRTTSSNTQGQAAGSELSLSVTATLLQQDEVIAGPQTLSVQREYFEDPASINSSTQERERLIEEMRAELVDQMLRSLQSVAAS